MRYQCMDVFHEANRRPYHTAYSNPSPRAFRASKGYKNHTNRARCRSSLPKIDAAIECKRTRQESVENIYLDQTFDRMLGGLAYFRDCFYGVTIHAIEQ
jgi:hypothetical protein